MVQSRSEPRPNHTAHLTTESGYRQRRRDREAQRNPFAPEAPVVRKAPVGRKATVARKEAAEDGTSPDSEAEGDPVRRGIGPLVMGVLWVAFWASPVLWILFGWWVLPVVFTLPWLPALLGIALISALDRLRARRRNPPPGGSQ